MDANTIAKILSIPSGYASLRLGMKLHPTQKEVLDSLFRDKKVSFRCGNGVGKTSVILVASILFGLEILNCQVVSTSATYRQVTSQLIPNLKKYSHLYPQWQFNDNTIVINGIKKYIGFSAGPDGASFQGYHEQPGQPLLILVDEAAGVDNSIFEQIDRCQPTYYLCCGSPLSPEGYFYKLETDASVYNFYKHYQLKQHDCLKSKGWWIKDDEVEQMILKWGGPQHPLVLSSVYAEFAINVDDCIITLSSLNKCINNPPEYVRGTRCVGIDFGGGKAETTVYLCMGNKVTKELSYIGEPMDSINKVVECLKRLKYDIGLRDNEINADADGLGVAMISRLKDLGYNVNSFHGNSTADNIEYRNIIAQAWIDGCRKIEKCELIIPNDDVLKMQLLSRKAKLNSSGKMQLESKQDMTKRGIASPDRADAFMMAVNGPINTAGEWQSIQPYRPSPKVYKIYI